MSGNDIFDKIDSKADEKSNSSGEEKKITLESILREYDAKKAEAERRAAENDLAEKRFSDFKRDLENYNPSVPEEEADEAYMQAEVSDDCDDSDMKILPASEEESFGDVSEPENQQIEESKLDIMSQISKRFESESAAEVKADEPEWRNSEVLPMPGAQVMPLDADVSYDAQDGSVQNEPLEAPETEERPERLSERFDDEALKNAFMDDSFESKKSRKKKKSKDSTEEAASDEPEAKPVYDTIPRKRRYDENGDRISEPGAMFRPVMEFTRDSDPAEAFAHLRNRLLGSCLAMFAVLILTFCCIYNEVAPILDLPHFRLFEPGKTAVVYVLFDLQLMLFAAIIKLNSLCKGASALFSRKSCSESIAFAVVLAATIHSVVSAVFASSVTNIPLMCSIACFSIFVLSVSDFFRARCEFMSFRILSSDGEKYAFKDIAAAGEETPDEISKFVPEGSTILDIRKLNFASDFFKLNASAAPADKNNGILVAVAFGVSLLAAVAFYAMNRGIYDAFCGFIAVFLTAVQSAALVSTTLPEFIYSDKAAARKCAFVGRDLCEEYRNVSVVSFKDVEVFSPKDIKVTNIRTYGDTRIDNVIVTMARIFSNVGGPLSSVFSNSVTGITTQNGEMKIIDVAPDGLWVKLDGYNTYIGTLSYMLENNFEVVPDNGIEAMRQSNCGILYLASSDRVIAKFYIEYKLNPNFESVLRNLYTQNICARIKTLDPCINNDFIRASLRRPECLFSVVKPNSPDEIEKTEDTIPARIVCSSNENSLIHSFLLIRKMRKAVKINHCIKIASTVIGLALASLILVGGSHIIAPALILALHVIWLVITVLGAKLSEK